MKKRVLLISIGIITVITIISALIFFDPFRETFDRLFKNGEDNGEIAENYHRKWYSWNVSGEDGGRIQAILNRYFDCFYSPNLKGNQEESLESCFAYSCDDCVYDLAALSSVLYRRDNFGINYETELCTLNLRLINLVEINKNGYIIMIEQSSEKKYKNLSHRLCGEGAYSHTFIFERRSGKWYITSHDCKQGSWKYARDKMNSLCGTENPSYGLLADGYTIFKGELEENVEETRKLLSLSNYPIPYTADISYNRQAAAEYAQKWCSPITETRNIDRWKDYDNDSVNFVSQCIFEGVGRMDTKGDLIWKWFDDKIEYYHEDSGRSMSWIEGANFWYYITSNNRRGLSATTDIGGGQLEIGDAIQLMLSDNVLSQVIVTDIVYDENGNKADFLVCGHDDELLNFPLSQLNYDSIRLIHIIGFNGE